MIHRQGQRPRYARQMTENAACGISGCEGDAVVIIPMTPHRLPEHLAAAHDGMPVEIEVALCRECHTHLYGALLAA